MIATITFTLPEESEAYTDAQRGTAYRRALQDFLEELRNNDKYLEDGTTDWRAVRELAHVFFGEVLRGL